MIKLTSAALGVALTFGALGWIGPVGAHAEECQVRGPQGPYRGRIIDTITSQSLPGAVVIIMWDQADNPVPNDTRTVAARETLTDAGGNFILDAAVIERGLPPRTLPPRILIFKPGYTTFPRKHSYPPGAPAAPFSGGGTTVMLTSVSDEEDRIEYFKTFAAGVSAAGILPNWRDPGLFPETARVMLDELKHFGWRSPRNP